MKKLITLLFCSVAFVACSDDDEHPTPGPTTNSGIRSGTTFTFTRTDFDVDGVRAPQVSDYTITIVQDSTINGEPWLVAVINDPLGTNFALLRFSEEGMFVFKDGAAKMDLKFHASTDDTWTNANGERAIVIAVDQSVSVPGGTYTNATYIETSDANSMENKIWYNNEQIMLKHEEYDDHPTQPGQMVIDYRDELKSVVL